MLAPLWCDDGKSKSGPTAVRNKRRGIASATATHAASMHWQLHSTHAMAAERCTQANIHGQASPSACANRRQTADKWTRPIRARTHPPGKLPSPTAHRVHGWTATLAQACHSTRSIRQAVVSSALVGTPTASHTISGSSGKACYRSGRQRHTNALHRTLRPHIGALAGRWEHGPTVCASSDSLSGLGDCHVTAIRGRIYV
jgi:hypothetical protein